MNLVIRLFVVILCPDCGAGMRIKSIYRKLLQGARNTSPILCVWLPRPAFKPSNTWVYIISRMFVCILKPGVVDCCMCHVVDTSHILSEVPYTEGGSCRCGGGGGSLLAEPLTHSVVRDGLTCRPHLPALLL